MNEALEYAAKMAKPFEGLRLKAYWDPVGYPTQGYGRLLSRVTFTEHVNNFIKTGSTKEEAIIAANLWLQTKYPVLSEEKAEIWLKEDMLTAYNAVRRLCPNLEIPKCIAALVDFTFNCGAGNLQISNLRRKVNRGELVDASLEFDKWVYARGIKLPGLVRRRQAEKQLFISGI